MSTLASRDALAPQSPGGNARGMMLAIAVHAALVAAIAWSVRWKSAEPEGVVAELWAAVPEVAAPRVTPAPVPSPAPPPPVVREPPPPPPPPREAEIAQEREKPKPPEKKPPPPPPEPPPPPPPKPQPKPKPEPPKPTPEEIQKAERAERAEQQRLAKLREENLKRMMAEAGGTGAPSATGQAARDAGPSASYGGRIREAVRKNIYFNDNIGNPRAEVEVRAAPDGTIVGRRIVKSSGQPAWDDAVLRALDRTGRLPRDVDGRVPSSMILGFTRLD